MQRALRNIQQASQRASANSATSSKHHSQSSNIQASQQASYPVNINRHSERHSQSSNIQQASRERSQSSNVRHSQSSNTQPIQQSAPSNQGDSAQQDYGLGHSYRRWHHHLLYTRPFFNSRELSRSLCNPRRPWPNTGAITHLTLFQSH